MKPKKLFGSNDTPSPSDFTLAINELTSKGWKPFEQLLCFKEENIAAMVSAYR